MKLKVALNMIVGPMEFEFFSFSVKSIKDAVDEIVIVLNDVDQKTLESVYETYSICDGKDIKILEHSERNFSKLRNLALENTQSDWIMKLDADEVFYNDVIQIRDHIHDESILGMNTWFYHLLRDFETCHDQVEHELLYHRLLMFRKLDGIYWQSDVHESIYFPPSLRKEKKIIDLDIHYVHFGYAKPQREVFRRWKLYSELEGQPNRYDEEFKVTGANPDTILDDRTGIPFMAPFPETIKEYCESVIKGEVERPLYDSE